MASFVTNCKYCGEEIVMSDEYDDYDEEGWKPYEIDSDGEERHDCRRESEDDDDDDV